MLKVISIILICSGPVCKYAIPNTEFDSVERCKTISPIAAGMLGRKTFKLTTSVMFQCVSKDGKHIYHKAYWSNLTASKPQSKEKRKKRKIRITQE